MQRSSGLEFTVAVIAGIIQLAQLVYLRRRAARGKTAEDFKRIPQHIEGAASGRLIGEHYHDDDDDDDDSANQDASRSDVSAARDNAPRVEPSGLGRDELNEWRS
ncbi:hypothetical protein F4860DRAFT_306412 [Xylaria cubensis]|nr:hypothetical protein F4860DRAFT_306412 [Xylaria cubensis]